MDLTQTPDSLVHFLFPAVCGLKHLEADVLLTCLIPWKKGSELDDTALAEGGVGGVLLRIPTVARKQEMHAGTA